MNIAVCWLGASVPTWIFYWLGRRAEPRARAIRAETLALLAAPVAGYEAAIAMALKEKEGAALQ